MGERVYLSSNAERAARATYMRAWREKNKESINARRRALRAAQSPKREPIICAKPDCDVLFRLYRNHHTYCSEQCETAVKKQRSFMSAEQIEKVNARKRRANMTMAQVEAARASKRASSRRLRLDPEHKAHANARQQAWQRAKYASDDEYREAKLFRWRRHYAINRGRNLTEIADWIYQRRGLNGFICGVVDGQGCGAALDLDTDTIIHIDHIVPVAKGGSSDLANLQLMHGLCNQTKNDSLADRLQLELSQVLA